MASAPRRFRISSTSPICNASASAVFFYLAAGAVGCRMQLCVADFFADLDKIASQVPKPLVLGDLPPCLFHGGGRNDFGNRLVLHNSCERVARPMAGRIGFGAMTGWFTALAKACNQRPGPEIVRLGEGNLQTGSLALKIVERLRQGWAPLSDSVYNCQK
jgi:hypothetical protein